MFSYQRNGPIITQYSPISSKGGSRKTKFRKRNFKKGNNKTIKSRTRRSYK
jgi:hypothetical protein